MTAAELLLAGLDALRRKELKGEGRHIFLSPKYWCLVRRERRRSNTDAALVSHLEALGTQIGEAIVGQHTKNRRVGGVGEFRRQNARVEDNPSADAVSAAVRECRQ